MSTTNLVPSLRTTASDIEPSIIYAETPELKKEVFRLRHQVYAIERGFEKPRADGIETDEWDDHSAHALVAFGGEYVSTARLILPNQNKPEYPLQSLYKDWEKLPIDWNETAEISRLACSKARAYILGQNAVPSMMRYLMKGIFQMSMRHSIWHWVMVGEPALIRLMYRWGIRFSPVGAPVEHHGMRQPCYVSVRDVLSYTRENHPDTWSFCTKI